MSRGHRENPMTQNMLSLFGMDPNAGVQSVGGADDEADLNAELAALLADDDAPGPKRPNRASGGPSTQAKKKPTLSLEQQVALALKDPTDDGDDEVDESDLMNELNDLMEDDDSDDAEMPSAPEKQPSPVRSQPAPAARHTAPPPAHVAPAAPPVPATPPTPPTPAAPTVPAPRATSTSASNELQMLMNRRDQYKVAALKAKNAGDLDNARRNIAVAKQFDSVISAAEAGQPIDLSRMPPPPGEAPRAQEQRQRSEAPASAPKSLHEDLAARMAFLQEKAQGEGNSSKARRLGRQVDAYKEAIAACKANRPYNYAELCLPPGFEPLKSPASTPVANQPAAPPTAPAAASTASASAAAAGAPKSLQEDLQKRMAVLAKSQAKAREEGNSSKARRLGRQVDAYKEAIVACKANKPYNYAELCLPPGFEPLSAPPASSGAPAAAPAAPRPPVGNRQLQRQLSRSANQTLVFLQDRQRQFKEAALKAKNQGKKDLALSLLRQAKGFDPMIGAAANGLPVDMSKLPPLPGEKEVDFEFLQAEDCEAPEDMQSDDPKVLFKQLASKLQAQMNLCRANSARCVKMGDVMTASKFDRLLKTSQLDLAVLRSAESHKDDVPRFHFEWKTFTTERTNPDLGEDAMELQIVRGIDLELPSGYTSDQLDTYVRAELPFPSSEESQVCRTDVIRGTNNPEYAGVHKFSVNRKARSFQRLVKSRAIKAEIFYKRGFLKGDKLLGTATIKMADLENHAEAHTSFDLHEGRKVIGGRLETRLRLREPLGGRQVEETREKWLVIDAASRPASAATASAATASSDPKPAASGTQSIEVMKYERDLLSQELRNRRSQLSPAAQDSLQVKGREIEKAIIAQDAALKAGGPAAQKAYAAAIEKLGPVYNAEARQALKENNRNKASVLVTKKKLCEKEAAAIRARLS